MDVALSVPHSLINLYHYFTVSTASLSPIITQLTTHKKMHNRALLLARSATPGWRARESTQIWGFRHPSEAHLTPCSTRGGDPLRPVMGLLGLSDLIPTVKRSPPCVLLVPIFGHKCMAVIPICIHCEPFRILWEAHLRPFSYKDYCNTPFFLPFLSNTYFAPRYDTIYFHLFIYLHQSHTNHKR